MISALDSNYCILYYYSNSTAKHVYSELTFRFVVYDLLVQFGVTKASIHLGLITAKYRKQDLLLATSNDPCDSFEWCNILSDVFKCVINGFSNYSLAHLINDHEGTLFNQPSCGLPFGDAACYNLLLYSKASCSKSGRYNQ